MKAIFYTSTALLYTFTVYTDFKILINKEHVKHGIYTQETFGGPAKYLTFINMLLQFIYFTLCAMNETTKSYFKTSLTIENICNKMYTSLVFPIGLIVTLLFWGIFHVDRELIYPEVMEKIVPSYQNHLVHTLPLFSSLCDGLVSKKFYERSFFKGAFGTCVFLAVYLTWVLVVKFFGNVWVYPILSVLDPIALAVFFSFCALVGIAMYKLGELWNRLLWDNINIKDS